MIVDTSAIMAILLEEPEQEDFVRRLRAIGLRRISAGSWIELNVVIARRGDSRLFAGLDALRREFPFEIAPVTAEQAMIGVEAYRAFGQGSGSAARLNFGDCFAYALAKSTGEPLLFKGDNFIHTDIPAT
jgi:ribonuclease VapC